MCLTPRQSLIKPEHSSSRAGRTLDTTSSEFDKIWAPLFRGPQNLGAFTKIWKFQNPKCAYYGLLKDFFYYLLGHLVF